jgi:FkbM family methyltransferase
MNNNILLVNTEYGDIYVMKNDIIGLEIINKGYHEDHIVKMLSTYTNNNTVIDIGSNIGSTSLALLSMDTNCIIYSFEPQLYLAKMQKDTMRVNNHLNRIRIFNNAVGHKCIPNISLSESFNHIDSLEGKNSTIKYDDDHVRNYGGINIGNGGEIVDMISIDSMFKNTTEHISLIKIDVEGAESLVIFGAKETIKKHKPVIFYEDNWKKITPDMTSVLRLNNDNILFNINSFLTNLGYKQCKKIDDNWLWIY